VRPIGFVLKGYPRISETFIAQEIRLLEKQGFEIEIYSMRGPREEMRHPVHEEIRAKVVYLPEGAYWRASVMGPVIRIVLSHPWRFARALGHALFFSMRRLNFSPLKRLLQAAWLCEREDIGGRVKHLHAHFLHSPAELAFYGSKLAGASFSISAHAKDIYTSSSQEIAERVRASRFLVTCTAFNQRAIQAIAGAEAGKVNLAYHGVNLRLFTPGEGGASRLFTVARLVDKKGHEDILRALALLRERGLDPEYDIYGEGGEKEKLARLAQELGLTRVRFHGLVAQDEVVTACRAGGVFVLASRRSPNGDQDGIPNSLAEAMSAGLPVVATRLSGIPELVDETCGLLVEERDPEGLANALEKVLRDPGLARRLGRAGREKVRVSFDADRCVQACADLLRPYAEAR
jgi:glycosyltransferase involved in cell wall biosynthesis